jgi:hypothetical protein
MTDFEESAQGVHPATRGSRNNHLTPRALVVAAAAAGVALRIYVYRSALGGEDSDEAILGLMVRHAVHGHLTTFLWGVAYGGTLEVLLTVPVFWLAGPNLLALRAVPLALDVATALLIWRAGRRLVGERPAVFAAALYWLWPAWSVYQHVHQFGFYASDTFFSALILLLALRAKEAPTAPRVGVLGLACGVAAYQTLQIVPIVAATAAWLAWREPRVLRQTWAAVLLAIAGILPALIWNARHGWASLHLESGAGFSYAHRLRVLFSPVLPEALGLRLVDSERWVVPGAVAVYLALFVVFAYGAFRSRRQDVMLLYVTAAVFPFVYALSEKATASSDPRYTLVLAPCLVLIAAQVMSTPRRAAAALGLALLLTTVGLLKADDWRMTHAGERGPSAPRSLAPLVARLDRLGVRRAFANYWVAYRLDFDTRERIIAVENGFDRLELRNGDVVPARDPSVRWRAYEDEVRSDPHGFVFFAHYMPPAKVTRTLARHGYERVAQGPFVIYARPIRR